MKSIGWLFLVTGGQVGRASCLIGCLACRQRAGKWAAVMMDDWTDSIAVHGVCSECFKWRPSVALPPSHPPQCTENCLSVHCGGCDGELHRTPRHGGREAKTFNRFVATHMPNEYIVCIAQQNSNLEFVSFFMYDIFDTVPFFFSIIRSLQNNNLETNWTSSPTTTHAAAPPRTVFDTIVFC